jgi:hypothetical protein
MAQRKIIKSAVTYKKGPLMVRLAPIGGKLYIQKWAGGVWVSKDSFSESGNTNNEFSLFVDSGKLMVQQIKNGGSWSGTEGVDYKTVGEFNKL